MKFYVFKSSKNTNRKSSSYFILINLLAALTIASVVVVRIGYLYFISINLLAVLQTWAVSLFFANSILPSLNLQQNIQEIAHAVGISIPLIKSYYGHKLLTFKK